MFIVCVVASVLLAAMLVVSAALKITGNERVVATLNGVVRVPLSYIPARIPATPTFVSYEGPNGTGAGWTELDWNPAGQPAATFQTTPGGGLSSGGDRGTRTFHEPREPDRPGGSVTFTSADLSTDQVLAGHPSLTMRASLDAPDANFYVELIDVAPDGTETFVNDGFLKASRRSTAATTGRPAGFEIPIRADHHRFAAGHRVRIRISGGQSSTLEPVDKPVTITITTGKATALRLPGFTSAPGR